MPQLNATLVPAPDQVVVRLTGDADLSTASLVTAVLVQAAGRGTGQVVVDVGRARFWDCSGLHALADFMREMDIAGRSCRVVGAQPATRRLIGMANLSADLKLVGSPPAAAGPPVAAARTPVRRTGGAAVSVTGHLVGAGHGR